VVASDAEAGVKLIHIQLNGDVVMFGKEDVMGMIDSSSIHVYTIAGSDSREGAGIQANLKATHTISGDTCHGYSAITCLMSQTSCDITSVHSLLWGRGVWINNPQ